MGFAMHAATASKDTTKVGAALVSPEGAVLLTGYNGPPMGVRDSPERFERPAKYLYASHAEQNVIAFAARKGIKTEGCDIYVTHAPCAACTKSLIQAGIKSVMVGDGIFTSSATWSEEIQASIAMMNEVGINFVTNG